MRAPGLCPTREADGAERLVQSRFRAEVRIDRAGGSVAGKGRAGRRPRTGPLFLAAVLVLFVAAVVRFVASAPALSAPAATAGPSTLDERIARLEARTAGGSPDVETWRDLGVAYIRQAAITGDPAYYALAERALDDADAIDPDAPGTVLARGELALGLHDFRRALELGRRAMGMLPKNAIALGIVVDAEVELGRYEDAAATAQEMLDVDPGLPALARASYLRQLHGDLDGALAAMQQAEIAASGQPLESAIVAALVGDLTMLTGDVDAAEGAYRRALRSTPGLPAAEIGLARVQAARGELDAAIASLDQLVADTPAPAALLLLGELRERAGRTEAAGDTWELLGAIVELQRSADQIVDLELALFEADHGDPDRAIELARRADAVRPDNVFVADAMAWSLHRAGRSDEALPYARRAMRLGSADPSVVAHAALVHAATGDEAAARARLGQLFAMAPWSSFGLLPEIRALADDLRVDAPPGWRSP